MPLVTCVDCGSEISLSATSCPKCGAPGPAVMAIQQKHQRLRPHLLGAAVAISLGMLGMIGIVFDILPIDGDAGILLGIVVCGLIVGGALWGLVSLFVLNRPQS